MCKMNMSRPVVLFFLLLVLMITSQTNWRLKVVSELDGRLSVSRQKQQQHIRRQAVQERIILSQEKRIQQLNKLVESLYHQLVECQSSGNTTTDPNSLEILNLGD